MTDTRHFQIPASTRRDRHVDIMSALARAAAIMTIGPDAQEFRRTGPYLLYLCHFPAPGQEMLVVPLLLDQGEIRVGTAGAEMFDRAWMYGDLGEAVAAACQWFLDREHRPEPEGWTRYTGPDGVRRRPKSAE